MTDQPERRYVYDHTSPETAYLVSDYPYGFRLRTEIRYWIETTSHGDRFVSQTKNPKTGRWNQPKKSTYVGVAVMYLDAQQHVQWTGITENVTPERLEAFTAAHLEHLSEQQRGRLARIIGYTRAMEHVTFSVHETTGQAPDPEHEAQQAQAYRLLNHAIAAEAGRAAQELAAK